MVKIAYAKFVTFCATRTYISLILAAIISSLGLFYSYSIDTLVNQSIISLITLSKNDSDYFQAWLKPETRLNMNVYIFNVTNADQFVEDCTDFNLTEKGPFSYKMFSGRKIVRSPEDEANSTLTYYDFKNFQLDVNGTHGNLNDPFVTIDVPTLVLNHYLKDNINDTWIDALVKFILTLNGQSLFQKISADELLFKGKRISILDTLKSGWELLHPSQPFPNVGLKDNTFSLFKSHNVTYFGPFEIYANGAKMGHFKSWHGLLSLDRWFGEECNKIRGTDGTFFPPFVDKTRKLYVFVPNFVLFWILIFLPPN